MDILYGGKALILNASGSIPLWDGLEDRAQKAPELLYGRDLHALIWGMGAQDIRAEGDRIHMGKVLE